MSPDRLTRFLSVRPFIPFVLHLGDGRAVDVRHPELATLLAGGRSIVVMTADESIHLIDVFLITGIEVRNHPSAHQYLQKIL